jgi:phosphatidylglycerophosphate synthase
MVTLTGLGLHVATAIYLVSARRPLPLSSVVVVLVGWQLAFSLDCADGQLARARSQANPFGAWLDQIADFISHTAVFLAFGIFLTRTLRLEAVDAVIAVTIIFGANILQLFASAERNALFGADEGIHGDTRRWIRILALARHLSDYGATLLISSLLLMAPEALLVFLLIASVLSGGLVFSQVGYGWMRRAGAG